MLAFVLKDGPPRRIACTNAATYTLLWPQFFTSMVPAARPLCRHAARHGAAVHGGLRMIMKGDSGNGGGADAVGGGCRLVATRELQAGTPLISLPLSLSLSVAKEEGTKKGTFAGKWDALEELTGLVVRHLFNPRSPHRRYLEFLHDLYNTDADADLSELGESLRAQVDVLYGGNAMHAKGAGNAPFLEKDTLQSPSQRVEWVRTQALVRRVEQGVPHFATKSAAWGLSMVLSRAFPDDEEGLSMYPLLDICTHSYEPNTALRVCTTSEENRRYGVKWHDDQVPCIHLVAQRTIAKGDEITRLFHPRRVKTREDAEFWQLRWGFVPPRDCEDSKRRR